MKDPGLRRMVAVLCWLMGYLAVAEVATAQLTNRSSVLDGVGTRSTGGSYTHIGAGAQPGGIAVSSGGSFHNQAGFLNTFFLQPGLDTDGDGLADEADSDNDNDFLTDIAEVTGSGFSPATASNPNIADSDGDGSPDGEEAVAGTDPSDDNAQLEITDITVSGGNRFVEWVARSNKQYRLLRADALGQKPTNIVAVVTANGPASPPWYVLTTSTGDVVVPTNQGFYAVEVLP